MQENAIRAKHKRRFKVTTDSKYNLPIAPNLLDRIHVRCAQSGMDLGHHLSVDGRRLAVFGDRDRPVQSGSGGLVTEALHDCRHCDRALTMAWFRRKPAAGLTHHSDRGSQYVSHVFQAKLKEYGMACSISRKGNCWDNAPTESWFGGFKNELVCGERFETRDEMMVMAFEYIEVFYNRKRQHSTLGYRSPMQFLHDWISAQQEEKLVA